MRIRPASQRPMKFPLRFRDRQIIDASVPHPHQSILRKFPILIAKRPPPLSRRIARFICKPHRNSIPLERPQFLDQPVLQFLGPLPRQESDDLLPPIDKFRPVPPPRIDGICQTHFLRRPRIPSIFRAPHFQNRRLVRKRRKWRPALSLLHCFGSAGHIFSPWRSTIIPFVVLKPARRV
jgi:hypothetical protein